MSTLTTADNSSTPLLFPISQGNVLPPIGQAFDVINGAGSIVSGFDPPSDADLIVAPRVNSNSKYSAIYDGISFSDAADFDFQTSGGGWVAQVGMTFSA